ncbi:MAG: 2-oxoacid:acceptor oxidoreductase subunit alpha [Porticoccaceae bacterium]|nr:2-oxoacid:acceptor oxidoreductase subunit alpha [Porticoccaceae bacterium]
MATTLNNPRSVSIAVAGSGGAGALTVGNLLFATAARVGWFGTFTRTLGPQIRGGESAAMVRLTTEPSSCPDDFFKVFLAIDWKNIERFASEIPLSEDSWIICDSDGGDIPEIIAQTGARIIPLPISEAIATVKNGRTNMVALGILAALLSLPDDSLANTIEKKFAKKGADAVADCWQAVEIGRALAAHLPAIAKAEFPQPVQGERLVISGNEATGLGALKGGIRFVAAYPITPATEVLEWMSLALPKLGGSLIQVEDELASINAAIGGSFGGIPSMTATSGPGLALMTESLGLAVAAEVPVVVVDVMRGGPSTGLPTKSEQSDLNIATYGLHGDAPHLVLAPTSVDDCLLTTQWSVHLAESLQTAAIVLSDQFMGQAKAAIRRPADIDFATQRLVLDHDQGNPDGKYERYAITDSGVSPMAIPGTPRGQYTADGLEHSPSGTPSTRNEHHAEQMDKRLRKLTCFDYGQYWASVEGDGDIAIITWGSTTGAAREAAQRLRQQGIDVRLIAVRLILPAQPEKMAQALQGVEKVLVVEQTHSGQYFKFLKAHYELPGAITSLHRAGPITIRPGEIVNRIKTWIE